MRNLNKVASLEDFKMAMSKPLELASPIGQEELLRQFGSTILNILQDSNTPAEVVPELVNHLNQYYLPIIEKGQGMSFNQNLYILGTINEVAFLKTNNPKYLLAAKSYYLKSFEIGPKRPQALFGLFDVYRIEGDVENTKKIANQILEQWPGEERTKGALQTFLDRMLTEKK